MFQKMFVILWLTNLTGLLSSVLLANKIKHITQQVGSEILQGFNPSDLLMALWAIKFDLFFTS